MPHKKKATEHAVILPALGSFILMLLLLVFLLRLFSRTLTERMYEEGADKARATAMRLDNYLDTASSILRVTADAVDHMMANEVSTEEILIWMTEETENQRDQFDENYTGLYGYIKQTYLDGTGWVPPVDYEPTTRDWYHAAKLARGAVTIATPYLDAHTGSMVVSICKRLDDGESVLAADLITNFIQSVVAETDVNRHGYSFVVNRDGTVIAHRDSTQIGESLFSRSYGTGLMQRVSGMQSGTFEMTVEGENSVLFAHPINESWMFVLVTPKRELLADVSARMYLISALFLAVYLLILLLYTHALRKKAHVQESGGADAPAVTHDAAPAATGEVTPAAPADEVFVEAKQETALEAMYNSIGALDLQEARRYLGSDELVEKTLRAFYEQIPEKADEIERLSEKKDYENYTIQVHALKSSARLVGANELSELARVLEACGNVIREKSG